MMWLALIQTSRPCSSATLITGREFAFSASTLRSISLTVVCTSKVWPLSRMITALFSLSTMGPILVPARGLGHLVRQPVADHDARGDRVALGLVTNRAPYRIYLRRAPPARPVCRERRARPP